MELTWLEDAVALIEEGSLSRAATRRNITQPAFSRRIRSLENWAGVSLLDRSSNRVDLKENLRENEAKIRALLQRLEELRSGLAHHIPGRETLSIASQHALSVSVLPEIYAALETAGQQISWRLRTLNRSDCISMFVRGDVEILLCYEAQGLPALPFDATVARLHWDRDMLIPVIGRDIHAQINQTSGVPDNIARISYPRDSHFGRLIAGSDAERSLQPMGSCPSISTAFTSAVLELVVSGIGVGWLPRSLARRALAAGEIVSLEATSGSFPLDVSMFAVSDNNLGRTVLHKFIAHLGAQMPDLMQRRHD
jgi:DNA-binding transcriptional LysR family regulator